VGGMLWEVVGGTWWGGTWWGGTWWGGTRWEVRGVVRTDPDGTAGLQQRERLQKGARRVGHAIGGDDDHSALGTRTHMRGERRELHVDLLDSCCERRRAAWLDRLAERCACLVTPTARRPRVRTARSVDVARERDVLVARSRHVEVVEVGACLHAGREHDLLEDRVTELVGPRAPYDPLTFADALAIGGAHRVGVVDDCSSGGRARVSGASGADTQV
jgi:hypothetical protein